MNSTFPFNIRCYTHVDQPNLISTINEICAEEEWTYTSHFQPTPAWHHAFEKPDCSCHRLLVVCVPNGMIVGWCDLFRGEDREEGVLGIGVLRPYREQGIGTRVLKRVLEWVDRQDFRRITLVVRSNNARAIHLYHNSGFRIKQIVTIPSATGGWYKMVRYHASVDVNLCHRQ